MGGNFQISMPVDRFEKRNMLRGYTTCKLLFTFIMLIWLKSNADYKINLNFGGNCYYNKGTRVRFDPCSINLRMLTSLVYVKQTLLKGLSRENTGTL